MPLSTRHSRASSVPSSPTRPPLSTAPIKPSTPISKTRSHDDHPYPPADRRPDRAAEANKASLLHPRVAVVLNVPRPWHPWLFAFRLSSILPAIWWGTPSVLQVLLRILEIVLRDERLELKEGCGTELVLATIWCFASGYLSFFFTDCLMSRWYVLSAIGPLRSIETTKEELTRQ